MTSSAFPTSLDTFTDPVDPGAGQYVWLDGSIRNAVAEPATILVAANPALVHETQHALANDALAAIQVKIGADNSAVTSTLDYLLKNAASVDPGHKHNATSINGLQALANVWTAAQGINLSSANAFFVGPNGATNPALSVVTNVASAVTGLSITGNASGAGVTLTALSSGSNEKITLTMKGTGDLVIGRTADTSAKAIIGSTYPLQVGSDSTSGAHFGLRQSSPNLGGGLSFAQAGDLIPIQIDNNGATTFISGQVNFGRAAIRWATSYIVDGDFSRSLLVGGLARTSGSASYLTVTSPADTTLTASTESIGVNFNLSATRQFATGAITTQREFVIQAPTYSFVGASTITTAATFTITGAPTAGPNATITNPYSLRIEAGTSIFGGSIIMPVGAANAASIGFAGDTNTGLYRFSSSVLGVTLGGTAYHVFSSNGVQTVGQFVLTATLGAADVGIKRLAAGSLQVTDASTGIGSLTALLLNSKATQTTYTGSISGTALWSMPFQGTSYKKFVISYAALHDAGGTITFPTAFTVTPAIHGDAAAVAISSASTTTFTIAVAGTITGNVFIEGY